MFSILKLNYMLILTFLVIVGAQIVCFITAYIYQQDSIYTPLTHCKNDLKNFFPTLSAVIGVRPQYFIWRICVALHLGPRFVAVAAYHSLYSTRLPASHRWLGYLSVGIHTSEILALVGLTYVSNKDSFPIHATLTVSFLALSLVYMGVTVFLFATLAKQDPKMVRSYRAKRALWFTFLAVGVGLAVFYYRHYKLCEARAFSYFAMFEYLSVFLNIAFHFTIALDFPDQKLVLMPVKEHPQPAKQYTNGVTNHIKVN